MKAPKIAFDAVKRMCNKLVTEENEYSESIAKQQSDLEADIEGLCELRQQIRDLNQWITTEETGLGQPEQRANEAYKRAAVQADIQRVLDMDKEQKRDSL